jgi:hypothetical protein
MKLSAEEIQSNWNELMNVIENNISSIHVKKNLLSFTNNMRIELF